MWTDRSFLYGFERQALRRGDFAIVDELVAAIRRFATVEPTLSVPWTNKVDQILIKLKASNTSATGHRRLTARTLAGPLVRRGGREDPAAAFGLFSASAC